MSKQEIVFIINPKAGKGNFKFENEIISACKNHGVNAIIEYTQAKNHAKELAKSYLNNGIKHFVAIGGDGTVNEVASQLINTEAKFSIIPLGSGNGLARMLNIPLDFNNSLNKVFDHECLKIDNGLLNDIPFFCTSGIGYDAYCADIFDKKTHGRGFWNYIKIVVSSIFKYKDQTMKFNGQNKTYFSITFANANQFGNNAFIAPDALIDDNYLDCTIIDKHPLYYNVVLSFLLMTKNIRKSTYVEYFRAKKYSIEAENDLLMHIDGDPIELKTNKAIISVNPNSLNVTI